MKPRVVFVGSVESVFVTRTAQALNHHGLDVQIINTAPDKKIRGGILSKITGKFFLALKTLKAVMQSEKSRTAVLLSLPTDTFWLAPLLKWRFRRVVGVAFGTDILGRNAKRDRWLRFGLKRLDAVSATNENVIDRIKADFPELKPEKFSIIRFGLPVFDDLNDLIENKINGEKCRDLLGYRKGRMLVSLGYCASPEQRQLSLINFFLENEEKLSQFDFVVPIQYGSPEVAKSVIKACALANKKLKDQRFHTLTDFHDPLISAHMRMATSVLVNHAVSDSFSGSVQEVVYAGNLVLAAKHLPYKKMPGFGTALRHYSSLIEALEMLQPHYFQKWQDDSVRAARKNRLDLAASSSWMAVFPDWVELISGAR